MADRDFVLEVDEREHFRMLMRMCEKFTGCRVLSYCLISNHFHVSLEVPPMPEGGISDQELIQRLGVFFSEAQVAREMEEAVSVRARGEFELPPVNPETGQSLNPAEELGITKMLRFRVRYFTDGAVIGSKEFVNNAFTNALERFGPKRKDGAMKLRGDGNAASKILWSLRDLRINLTCATSEGCPKPNLPHHMRCRV